MMTSTLLILIYLVIANLPWLNDRVFLIYPLSSTKSPLIRLIELVSWYFIGLLVGVAFELQFSGDIYQQEWEFFVTTFCLFLVFAVPGVVYRYQWLPLCKKNS